MAVLEREARSTAGRLFLPLLFASLVPGCAGRSGTIPPIVSSEPIVACHVTYGGETRLLSAPAGVLPYEVSPTAVGSYFLFRVLLEDEPAAMAAIKIYIYADKEEGPVPLAVASFPYPPSPQGREGYGFTGLQWVYEPIRDGELLYWCELGPANGVGER